MPTISNTASETDPSNSRTIVCQTVDSAATERLPMLLSESKTNEYARAQASSSNSAQYNRSQQKQQLLFSLSKETVAPIDPLVEQQAFSINKVLSELTNQESLEVASYIKDWWIGDIKNLLNCFIAIKEIPNLTIQELKLLIDNILKNCPPKNLLTFIKYALPLKKTCSDFPTHNLVKIARDINAWSAENLEKIHCASQAALKLKLNLGNDYTTIKQYIILISYASLFNPPDRKKFFEEIIKLKNSSIPIENMVVFDNAFKSIAPKCLHLGIAKNPALLIGYTLAIKRALPDLPTEVIQFAITADSANFMLETYYK